MGFASLYPSCEVRGVRGASFTGIRGEGTVAPATGSGSLVGKAHPNRYPDPVFEPPPAPMIAAVRPMIALLAGVALLLMGSGLLRSEEQTSEHQSLMRISYAVFCLRKKWQQNKEVVRQYSS